MTRRDPDREKLRSSLRHLSRGNLLIVAQRAADLVPKAKLQALVGDMIRIETRESRASRLLDEVRRFHAAALRGEYYESFDVNSKNYTQHSHGTDAFIAEFDHILRKTIRASEKTPRARWREAFELLFGLLRHIDECHDDVIFFADEAGSWQVGVDWRTALPVYFRCLAEGASSEEFAREVDRAISDFDEPGRIRHMATARRAAGEEQRAALRRFAAHRGQA
ncbi:MAG TPA: hypothetical protein VJQ57_09590 [Acidimicrobiia bacterium]|nr:hypothetical protein [Acidimicrobiia bacterium]